MGGRPTYHRKDDLDLKKRFDPEPLLAFIARRAKEHPSRSTKAIVATSGEQWLINRFGKNASICRQFSRWKQGNCTLSWWYADRVAGLLGVHPAWIWPDWYDGVPEVDELEVAA